MITLCWSAKGGSGTTVVAAALALNSSSPTLLVDLAGDIPAALGVAPPGHPGVLDWLDSDAACERLGDLLTPAAGSVTILHQGLVDDSRPPTPRPASDRWMHMATWLGDWAERNNGAVVIDAGTGEPPPMLVASADRAYLVTRPCYLSLRRAARQAAKPTAVIVVDDGGRRFTTRDIEHAIGAPVVTRMSIDPTIARAVDSGLLSSRMPTAMRRDLRTLVA